MMNASNFLGSGLLRCSSFSKSQGTCVALELGEAVVCSEENTQAWDVPTADMWARLLSRLVTTVLLEVRPHFLLGSTPDPKDCVDIMVTLAKQDFAVHLSVGVRRLANLSIQCPGLKFMQTLETSKSQTQSIVENLRNRVGLWTMMRKRYIRRKRFAAAAWSPAPSLHSLSILPMISQWIIKVSMTVMIRVILIL